MKRLALRGLSKAFGAVAALSGVDLEIVAGEVHALVGENGAGKSTLVRVLAGLETPDAGSLTVDDETHDRLDSWSPATSRAAGIGVIHQHDTLVDAFTIEENLALSGVSRERLPPGFELPALERRAGELSVGERQRVEIARALAFEPLLLVLDEPTAVLTPHEAAWLLAALRGFAARGVASVFISHYLDEVIEIADRITVLRRGRVVARARRGEIDRTRLGTAMVGETTAVPQRRVTTAGRERWSVAGLATQVREDAAALYGIDLTVRAGECLGIAGVAGNGQRALAAVLSGRMRPSRGSVRLDGAEVAAPDLRPARPGGLAIVPEDRRSEGLALTLSIAENLLLGGAALARVQRGAFLRRRDVVAHARTVIADYEIHGATPDTLAGALSGGNQQRVVLARELAGDPSAVLLVQPTRGLDIRAAAFVHAAIERLRERGSAVLLISTDLDEVRALCDRILVLVRGRVVAELPRGSTSAELGRALGGADLATNSGVGERA